MKIVVIGGTGLVGSRLVSKLAERGHEAVAASRRTGVDALTGAGLAAAIDGAAAVVDVSGELSFEDSTRNLLAAEETLGVGHHVALTVVGADRLTEGEYYRAKLTQESLIRASPIPYSIVRSTQFFEFMVSIAAAVTDGNVVRLPPALDQPIAADDVAATLARVAIGPALNRTVEVAGPERFRLDELVGRELEARNDPREVITDPHARYFGIGPGERTLLPSDAALLGRIRYDDWSAEARAA